MSDLNLKDKLYFRLVESNYKIKVPYQNYINSDKEFHKKNRLKSWNYLLKLLIFKNKQNVKIPYNKNLNKKNISNQNKKIRLPYLNGSESSINNRIEPNVFLLETLKYEVISFDIFDTLIFRPFSDPKTLFTILGKDLNIYNFYKIRTDSEKEARENSFLKYGNYEINIFDIYKIIEDKIGLNAKFGATKELEYEFKYCYANPYMKAIYKCLKEAGKTLVATSDMYIPKEYLEKILHKNGYDFDNILVSCDYHCSKRFKDLYLYLLSKYKNKKIIHIGDNYLSDYLKSREIGINSIHYKNVNEIGNFYRAEGMSNLTESLYNGIINNNLHNGFDNFSPTFEYGFIYGGLYVLGYMNWLNNLIKEKKIDKVLFLARDGSIYKKVFRKLNQEVNIEYFLWSRIIGMKTSVNKCFDEYIDRNFTYKISENLKVVDLLKSNNLDFLVNKKGYDFKEDEILSFSNLKKIKNFLVENKKEIIKYFENENELTYQIIKKSVGKSSKIAIVDVGWAGSGPLGLKDLIENELKLNCKVYCCLAASHHHVKELSNSEIMNEDLNIYLFSQMKNRINYDFHSRTNRSMNNIFFELFTQDKAPSFSGYKNNKYNFDFPEVENYKAIEEIHNGIEYFVDKYLEFFGDKNYLLNISGYDAYLPFRFIVKNPKFIAENFQDFSMARHVGLHNETCKIETIKDHINKAGIYKL